jgi:hypothetical protein
LNFGCEELRLHHRCADYADFNNYFTGNLNSRHLRNQRICGDAGSAGQ